MTLPWNTIGKVAEVLQVSARAVLKFIAAGDVEAYELAASGGARQWVVPNREVDRLVLQRAWERGKRRKPRKVRVRTSFKQRPLPLELDPPPAIRAVPPPLGRFRMAKASFASAKPATKVRDREPPRSISMRKSCGVA